MGKKEMEEKVKKELDAFLKVFLHTEVNSLRLIQVEEVDLLLKSSLLLRTNREDLEMLREIMAKDRAEREETERIKEAEKEAAEKEGEATKKKAATTRRKKTKKEGSL